MPNPKPSESARPNRLLLGVAFGALVLLGPAFTLGYLSGYRSGRAVPSAAPVETAPQPSTGKEQRKSGTRAQATTTAAGSRAGRAADGNVYLQLVATAESDSEAMLGVLRDKGFPAVTVEIPKRAGVRRVLVGPLKEAELEKTRADLKSSGFPGDSAIRRRF